MVAMNFFSSLKQDIILWIHKSCGSVCTVVAAVGEPWKRQSMLYSDIIILVILNVFKVLVMSLSRALN